MALLHLNKYTFRLQNNQTSKRGESAKTLPPLDLSKFAI